MKLRNVFVCAIVCLVALPVMAAGTVTPGKWEVTVEMEMVGMAHKMPPTTMTHCISKADVEKAEGLVPKGGKDAKDCKYYDVVMSGNTVSWKMECSAQNLKGEGKMTYESESYTGTSHIKMGEMEMKQKFTGKRLGECEK